MNRRELIAQAIRRYFDACNAGDRAALTALFTPDAVHYFPKGSPFGAFRGADAIAHGWIACIETLGSSWTIDNMLIDESANAAVIEWTHFQPKRSRYVRGDEWYKFNDKGLITEIRAYYACPATPADSHELDGFPYHDRGYPVEPPVRRTD
jgi:ketosteroid isomerase-like protein